jgi:hypothetical protein
LPKVAHRRSIASAGLSETDLLPIVKKSEMLLLRRVGGLITEITEELLRRQTTSSRATTLLKREIIVFTAGYSAAVRETTGEFAGELAQALGRRKGLGNQQLQWVRVKIGEFVTRMTAAETAEALFREAFSSRFTLANEEKLKKDLVSRVTSTKGIRRPLLSANEAIEHAVALYPAPKHSRKKPRKIGPAPSPGKQVADPISYPTMTVTDVQKLFHKSRSTIYLWLDGGKLKRAAMGQTPGKRTSCLILTSSVKRLLDESAE